MTKQASKKYFVNYDTKWTHYYLKDTQALYFSANTPVQEIIPQLERYLKQNGPKNLMADYTKSNTSGNFSRLYRNLYKSYLGWQVSYRKPDSRNHYASISEKIGYKQQESQNRRVLKQLLNKNMIWKHDLTPGIKPVEINGVDTCKSIAERLNNQYSQTSLKLIIQTWLPYLNNLKESYYQLTEENLYFNGLLEKNDRWQRFFNNLESLNRCSKPVLNFKSLHIYQHNVYDILMSNCKTAKGWRVEFLDEK